MVLFCAFGVDLVFACWLFVVLLRCLLLVVCYGFGLTFQFGVLFIALFAC